jgi:hypothetical protein
MRKGKDPKLDPYPYLSLADPDPGGPKTCAGSGSPTLPNSNIKIYQEYKNKEFHKSYKIISIVESLKL